MTIYQFKFKKNNESGRGLIRYFYFLWIGFLFLDASFNTWRKKFKIEEDFPYQTVPTYLQHLFSNPMEFFDWFFAKLMLITILLILAIQFFLKHFPVMLNITPEKIYWSLQNFTVYMIAKREDIQHIELIKPKKIFKSSPDFLQIYFHFQPRKHSRFFNILGFPEADQKTIIHLCQKYYNLNPEVQHKSIFKQQLKQSMKMINPIISYTILALVFIFIVFMLFFMK